MNKRLFKKVFPLIAFLLLIPWPVAYAYDTGAAGQETIQIEVAEASAKPIWTAFGKAIGGVDTPGDLFHVDASDVAADVHANLHITNTQELIHAYRYLILEVGVYQESKDGSWTDIEGQTTYITLRNGQVSFTLPGCGKYRISIDGGSFYSYGLENDKAELSPNFYLEID